MIRSQSFKGLIAVALLITSLSACTRDISGRNYVASSVGEASETYQGRITNVRLVNITGADTFEGNETGIALGAVSGGLIGSAFGGGTGRTAAIATGAVLGGVLGSKVESDARRQQAYEYTVKLNGGRMLTVVQGLDEMFSVGQKVLVIKSRQGRSRIVADHS